MADVDVKKTDYNKVMVRAVEGFITAWIALFIPLATGILTAPDFSANKAAVDALTGAACYAVLAALKQITGVSTLDVVRGRPGA